MIKETQNSKNFSRSLKRGGETNQTYCVISIGYRRIPAGLRQAGYQGRWDEAYPDVCEVGVRYWGTERGDRVCHSGTIYCNNSVENGWMTTEN